MKIDSDKIPGRVLSNKYFLFGLVVIMICIGRLFAFLPAFTASGNDKTYVFLLPAIFGSTGFLIWHIGRKWFSSGRKGNNPDTGIR
jgi:hypothetical protein